MRRGFTLVELLVTLAVISILAALSLTAISGMKGPLQAGTCIHSLQQLSAATNLYLGDHAQTFFPYSRSTSEGKEWYFGLEPWSSVGAPEGQRVLDPTRGPLAPYLEKTGKVAVCPAFPYGSALWKPKFKGASYGYGYNTYLSNQRVTSLAHPSRVVIFGDCAQVNTFQAPASASHPMIEEFYLFDSGYKTAHFRHGNVGEFLFVDGHVEALKMSPGTRDERLPDASIGRIAPAGSMDYLQ